MRKLKATILSMMAISAFAFAGVAGLCAEKSNVFASADTTPNLELISPTTYQQYLRLETPSSIAVSNAYTAIVDGKTIHVYDSAEGIYRKYIHTDGINQIALDGDNNLYFLSNDMRLYCLSMSDLKANLPATDSGIICLGFSVSGNWLHYYNMSKNEIRRYSLSTGETEVLPTTYALQDQSPLACGKDGLYYVAKNNNAYTVYATGNNTPLASFTQPLKSIAVTDTLFCAVTDDGTFYAYNSKNVPITEAHGNYVSVCANGENVYAVQGTSVRHYSVENAGFTDFEISAASGSPNRFNGANDVYLSENKLFIADDGNNRISVYDTQTKQFGQAISTPLASPFLTSYADTLLVSSAQEAVVYSLATENYGAPILQLPDAEIDGNVIGAACIYDRYYLLTDDHYCYTLSASNGVWTYTETQKTTLNAQMLRAETFTADVYGSLYVAYNNGTVYRFTEKELTAADASGTQILTGVTNAEKIAVDYETNLYALQNGVLTKYSPSDSGYTTVKTYSPYYNLVQDETPMLASFAFGVENEYVYFLYENNYLVKSDELHIPIVNPIPVGDAANRVFGTANRDFAVVTVAVDTILTEFDISALQTATEFPYLAFERAGESFTALKIGEEGGYAILAVANSTGGYKTYLALNTACTTLSTEEYRLTYTTPIAGYVTNSIPLYKFPYITDLLTVSSLPRGAQVSLLGEVHKLNYSYYEVSFTTESGEIVTGFIPTNYVMLFDGTSPETRSETFGSTEDDKDAIWRFTYIILGFAAIGILVDFLLLYKPKHDENE